MPEMKIHHLQMAIEAPANWTASDVFNNFNALIFDGRKLAQASPRSSATQLGRLHLIDAEPATLAQPAPPAARKFKVGVDRTVLRTASLCLSGWVEVEAASVEEAKTAVEAMVAEGRVFDGDEGPTIRDHVDNIGPQVEELEVHHDHLLDLNVYAYRL